MSRFTTLLKFLIIFFNMSWKYGMQYRFIPCAWGPSSNQSHYQFFQNWSRSRNSEQEPIYVCSIFYFNDNGSLYSSTKQILHASKLIWVKINDQWYWEINRLSKLAQYLESNQIPFQVPQRVGLNCPWSQASPEVQQEQRHASSLSWEYKRWKDEVK